MRIELKFKSLAVTDARWGGAEQRGAQGLGEAGGGLRDKTLATQKKESCGKQTTTLS